MIWFVALGLVVQAGINWWLIQRARAARNDNQLLARELVVVQRVAAQAAGAGTKLDAEDAEARAQVGDLDGRVTALEQRAAIPPAKKEPSPRRAATGAQAMRMIETAVAAETRDDADKQDVGREG